MQENYIDPYSLSTFIQLYAKSLIRNLQKRFLDAHLYHTMRILDPILLPNRQSELAVYGNREIDIIGEFYGKDIISDGIIVHHAIIQKYELLREWSLAKILMTNFKNSNFIRAWFDIFSLTNFRIQFPSLTKIIELILVISFSNASVERIFHNKI